MMNASATVTETVSKAETNQSIETSANLPALSAQSINHLESIGPKDLLQAWLAGKNAQTLIAYRKDIEDFRKFLKEPTGSSAANRLLSLSQGQANAVVLSYRTHLTERGLAPATVARRLAALRSLVKLARMLGRVSWALDIESPHADRLRDTTGPGDEGWRAILKEAKRHASKGDIRAVRDLAIIRLLHDLGLRRGEVARLAIGDCDLENASIQVLGKGRAQTETLTLPDPVERDLNAWIQIRGQSSGHLFLRLDAACASDQSHGRSKGLTGESIRRIVARLAKASGLKKRVRPHGLRHQAITAVLDRNGGDLRAASRFSRHKDINTLTKYDDNRKDLGGEMAKLISED